MIKLPNLVLIHRIVICLIINALVFCSLLFASKKKNVQYLSLCEMEHQDRLSFTVDSNVLIYDVPKLLDSLLDPKYKQHLLNGFIKLSPYFKKGIVVDQSTNMESSAIDGKLPISMIRLDEELIVYLTFIDDLCVKPFADKVFYDLNLSVLPVDTVCLKMESMIRRGEQLKIDSCEIGCFEVYNLKEHIHRRLHHIMHSYNIQLYDANSHLPISGQIEIEINEIHSELHTLFNLKPIANVNPFSLIIDYIRDKYNIQRGVKINGPHSKYRFLVSNNDEFSVTDKEGIIFTFLSDEELFHANIHATSPNHHYVETKVELTPNNRDIKIYMHDIGAKIRMEEVSTEDNKGGIIIK